ncbi:MAG: hypothetical protein GXZ10_12985 [Gammaproteobacteria bacterium]|nr:hypothetical protein [Gammaproteobacteria bacterium]
MNKPTNTDEDFLRQKVEAGRESMRMKEGRSNEDVEAKFSERRIEANLPNYELVAILTALKRR